MFVNWCCSWLYLVISLLIAIRCYLGVWRLKIELIYRAYDYKAFLVRPLSTYMEIIISTPTQLTQNGHEIKCCALRAALRLNDAHLILEVEVSRYLLYLWQLLYFRFWFCTLLLQPNATTQHQREIIILLYLKLTVVTKLALDCIGKCVFVIEGFRLLRPLTGFSCGTKHFQKEMRQWFMEAIIIYINEMLPEKPTYAKVLFLCFVFFLRFLLLQSFLPRYCYYQPCNKHNALLRTRWLFVNGDWGLHLLPLTGINEANMLLWTFRTCVKSLFCCTA